MVGLIAAPTGPDQVVRGPAAAAGFYLFIFCLLFPPEQIKGMGTLSLSSGTQKPRRESAFVFSCFFFNKRRLMGAILKEQAQIKKPARGSYCGADRLGGSA